jgi:hypothetical protein
MGSHERARTDRDPAAGLRQAANIQRRQFEIMLDVILVFQEAARTDPDIAAATHRILANRERGFRTHLEAIKSHLAPGVSVDDASRSTAHWSCRRCTARWSWSAAGAPRSTNNGWAAHSSTACCAPSPAIGGAHVRGADRCREPPGGSDPRLSRRNETPEGDPR